MALLSIIIPVKPPEPYLEFLLAELSRELNFPYEVLIQTEKGLGYAVMCGIKRAKGEFVCVCDADGSHPPQAVNPMLQLAKNGADIVVGSRYCGGHTQDSIVRQLISRIYCFTAQAMFRLAVKDSMSGFVLARRQVFLDYPIKNRGYKLLLELLVASRLSSYRAAEYPICFASRKAGKSKASPMEAINTLLFMLRLRLKN